VLPELVSSDSEGYKSVAHANLTAILVEAVKVRTPRLRGKATRLSSWRPGWHASNAASPSPGPQASSMARCRGAVPLGLSLALGLGLVLVPAYRRRRHGAVD
jgi:hypothetical protein